MNKLGKNLFLVAFQYLIYDFNALVADVGGYLGLLLGHSVYGIYVVITNTISKAKMKQTVHPNGPSVHRQTQTQTSIFVVAGADSPVRGAPSAKQQPTKESGHIRYLDTLV